MDSRFAVVLALLDLDLARRHLRFHTAECQLHLENGFELVAHEHVRGRIVVARLDVHGDLRSLRITVGLAFRLGLW